MKYAIDTDVCFIINSFAFYQRKFIVSMVK